MKKKILFGLCLGLFCMIAGKNDTWAAILATSSNAENLAAENFTSENGEKKDTETGDSEKESEDIELKDLELMDDNAELRIATGSNAVPDIDGFVPRWEEPEEDNIYFYSDINPFVRSGYGLPNCTAYAYGRAYEIMEEEPELSIGDAYKWYEENKRKRKYAYGSEPRLGAIACWGKNSQGNGHVAVVETVEDDYVLISESGYSWNDKIFQVSQISYDGIYRNNFTTDSPFIGYIYIDEEYKSTGGSSGSGSSGGGGGSSGGGGGSSGGGGGSFAGSTGAVVSSAPAQSYVTGTWSLNQEGRWTFVSSAGENYRNQWVAIASDSENIGPNQKTVNWFYFDQNGLMHIGWLDYQGNRYYLSTAADGNQGRMLKGWQMIGDQWYYMKPESGADEGSVATGWKVIDGVKYYFSESADDKYGALLETIN